MTDSVQHYTLVAGKSLSPSIAFTSIAVFDELRFALGALPETFIQALQGEFMIEFSVKSADRRLCILPPY